MEVYQGTIERMFEMNAQEAYSQVETMLLSNIDLGQHIVKIIAEKLDKEPQEVQRAIYQAGLGSGTKVLETALIVHEFLVALNDLRKEETSEQS